MVKAEDQQKILKDDFLSVEHVILALFKTKTDVEALLKQAGLTYEAVSKALTAVRGSQRVVDQDPEGKYSDAGEIRHRSHRSREAGQDRSRHRPRRRDPSRDAGAQPPHQKQPGAHRRARRRQDGHRRRPRPSHRRGRRARLI